MARIMSFSDRQHFVQSLAVVRNLAIACGIGEERGSPLKEHCRKLIREIDNVSREIVGDAYYDRLRDASA
jgi:hypothetical protein